MRKFTFWAVALAVLVIVAFNVQGWLVLARTSRVLEKELGDRLQAVATTLATVLAGRFDTPGSERLLVSVMEENGLFNLYIVNDRLEYAVNLRNKELVGQSDPCLELDMTEILATFSGLPTQSRLYEAGGYYLKSAYAPLEDGEASVVAVLGVEADATFFSVLTGFRNSLLLVNVLSLLAITAVVLVSVGFARHALRLERAASRANTLALMGQMSAAVAHEIKNPLGIIRAAAERLKKRYGAKGDDETFDYIQEEVDRLAGVVSNYLGVGTSRPGETEPLDMDEVVNGVIGDLRHQAEKKNVELSASLDDLPRVVGNRNEIRQVFLNLVLNGIQAQPDGGRLEVSAGVERKRGKEWVVVWVRDQGPGIDKKVLNRVFEPFYTTKEKGSGLGLFVVKRIIEAHRGRVLIGSGRIQGFKDSSGGVGSSDQARGTTVEVRLPV